MAALPPIISVEPPERTVTPGQSISDRSAVASPALFAAPVVAFCESKMFSDDPDRMLELPQPARNNASDVPAVKTAARREVGQLCSTLLERVRRKTVTQRAQSAGVYRSRTKINKPATKRASSDESTTPTKRAS